MTFHYVPAIDLRDEVTTTIFTITLQTGRVIDVTDANTYQPEGPLTTFFRTGSSSPTIDVWSERVASFRTVDIVSIHQCTLDRPTHPSAQNLEGHQGSDRPGLSLVPASA